METSVTLDSLHTFAAFPPSPRRQEGGINGIRVEQAEQVQPGGITPSRKKAHHASA